MLIDRQEQQEQDASTVIAVDAVTLVASIYWVLRKTGSNDLEAILEIIDLYIGELSNEDIGDGIQIGRRRWFAYVN
jgi:hypothetical protein